MLRGFNQYRSSRTIFLVLSENVLILAAIQLAAFLLDDMKGKGKVFHGGIFLQTLIVTGICQLCLYFNDLYDLRIVGNRRELFLRLMQSLGICSISMAVLYLTIPFLFLGDWVFLTAILILLTFLTLWRLIFSWVNKQKQLKTPLLILGTSELSYKLSSEILTRPEVGFRVVGLVSCDSSEVETSFMVPSVIGRVDDLISIVQTEKVERVVVSVANRRGNLPVAQLLELKMKGIEIEEAADLYEKVTGKIAMENLHPSWLIFSPGFRKTPILLSFKRFSGVLFSLIGLILSFPIVVIVILAIKLDSRGPVFFKQERMGENGKTFNLLKFRSMRENAELDTGPVWAAANDSRVTRVGRWIRKTRLDELPQFINILRGDLNFVGPRPERPHFVSQLASQIPYYNLRHTIKPGLTGWAQIKYGYGSSQEDTLEKLQYDLYYIKNLSLSLDLSIILQTIKIVLLGRGSR